MRRALAIAAIAVLAAGCGESEGDAGDPTEPAGAAGVTVEREDGTPIAVDAPVQAFCGPLESGIEAVYVAAGERRPGGAYWALLFPTSVADGSTVPLPADIDGDRPKGAVLYVGDPDDPESERSSEAETSSGTVAIHEHTCEEGGTVHVTIDAVVGGTAADDGTAIVRGDVKVASGPAP